MKKAILFLLIVSSFSARAQSLKDLLYSGKLKMDSNTVVRKTDDLSEKIDTTTRKPEAEKPKTAAVAVPDSARNAAAPANTAIAASTVRDSAATAGTAANTSAPVNATSSVAVSEPVDAPAEASAPAATAKNNNQIWKGYIDSLVATLKTEVLPSKKIKKETYFLYVDYEIGTEGQVSITNVVATPENEFLQNQVKERLLLGAPQLNPVLDSTGKARKVKRKYNFNITKE